MKNISVEVVANRFIEYSDCFLDMKTGFVWSKMNENLSWKDAIIFSKKLDKVCGYKWRLPSIEELITLIDFSISGPATKLPGVYSEIYWSSSNFINTNKYVWTIYFGDGYIDKISKTTTGNYARYVSGPIF
jgi:hypothetical protein